MATTQHGQQNLGGPETIPAPRLNLRIGDEVEHFGQKAVIRKVHDLNSVLLTYVNTEEPKVAKVVDLQPPKILPSIVKTQAPTEVTERDLERATNRFNIIKPLIDTQGRTRSLVSLRAREFNRHPNTIYNWLSRYDANPILASLIPKHRTDAGRARVEVDREAIIQQEIQIWLSPQRKSVRNICEITNHRLKNAGLPAVHYNTIRSRILKLSDYEKVARRHNRAEAEKKYEALHDRVPATDWPLADTEIDHTKLDAITVDSINRHPTIRPWITVLIDDFSRMILGFYLSYDPPGSLSVGLCIANAVLSKEEWVSKLGLNFEWPCWGFPAAIRADNAGEFRSKMLKTACQQYGMDLIWRPVGKPRYGAYIERFLGTLNTAIYALPGTTFSNTRDRGDYDSNAKAIFTLDELEKWLVTRIVQYHNTKHSSLGVSPLRRFEEGVLRGSALRPATGLPPRIIDPAARERLRLDLMPYIERTVQRYGVALGKHHYYSDVLQPWINALDPKNPKLKRKFQFRRDPRDISQIWFLDPEIREYYAIPFRNTSIQTMSLWEEREARNMLRQQGTKASDMDEQIVSNTIETMREMEDDAKRSTKKARTRKEKRRHWSTKSMTVQRGNVVDMLPTPSKDYVRVSPFTDNDE